MFHGLDFKENSSAEHKIEAIAGVEPDPVIDDWKRYLPFNL
jgi:hypothetical protein